jgi:hypothetical protein
MTVIEFEKLVQDNIFSRKKITKKLLFKLPYGYSIMSNNCHELISHDGTTAFIEGYFPHFHEDVSPLDDREFQWNRLKEKKVQGKMFFILPFTIKEGERIYSE